MSYTDTLSVMKIVSRKQSKVVWVMQGHHSLPLTSVCLKPTYSGNYYLIQATASCPKKFLFSTAISERDGLKGLFFDQGRPVLLKNNKTRIRRYSFS
jgi:hypothetical protein